MNEAAQIAKGPQAATRQARELWPALVFVVTLSVAVRSYHIGLPALTRDEAFSWRLTQYSVPEMLWHAAADVHPPLYYLLLKAWSSVLGAAPSALRGFSVLCAGLSVVTLYAVCVEANRLRGAQSYPGSGPVQGAALLSALLFALHPAQVQPSQSARMYGLGALLAGLTAWLLLRALRSGRQRIWWWSSYGLAVGLFCGTHYYALFTLTGQVLFVAALLLLRGWKKGWRTIVVPVAGFGYAGVLALLLYSPWLHIFWSQVQAVRDDYWIPAVSVFEAGSVFGYWCTGWQNLVPGEVLACEVTVAIGVTWLLVRGGVAAWFFALQAAAPWALSLGLSAVSSRPIFLDRYLVFAHFFFIGLGSVLWTTLPSLSARLAAAYLLASSCVYGLGSYLAALPASPPALAHAAAFLKTKYRAGDMIYTECPGALNQLRCYATEAGVTAVDVRCTIDVLAGKGHIPHVASLESRDVLPADFFSQPRAWRRLWVAGDAGGGGQPLDPSMFLVLTETFVGGGGTFYALALYERGKSRY
jgi:hypothetical protein